MENATKALVIAGAVLITILLISVGIMVFNSAKEPLDSMNTDSYAIEQFNANFTGYLGTTVKGSSVKSLLNAIRSSNATNDAHQVTVNGAADVPSNNTITSSLTYNVDADYVEGYITNININ